MSDRRTLDAIAAETGVTPGPALFADALSAPGEGGETYLAMIQHNADTLVKVMAGN